MVPYRGPVLMLELIAQVEPMSLPLWAVLAFSAAMYPLGFMLGAPCSACCGEVCSNLTCDGFDLTAAYESPAGNICGIAQHRWDGGDQYGPYGTAAPTCDNDPPAVPTGCEGSSSGWRRRRSCVRFVCRCYESSGENTLTESNENPPTFNPDGGYTVTSTTVLGGPTTNDLNLGDELDAATSNGHPLEADVFVNTGLGDFTRAAEGTPFCVVWVFSFYGWVRDCETQVTGFPTQHESRDDCYTITACTRCA